LFGLFYYEEVKMILLAAMFHQGAKVNTSLNGLILNPRQLSVRPHVTSKL